MTEYRKYQHVEKLGNTEVEGIELGDCYIFPKIDGTNAHVWLDREDNLIKFGSRKRQLTLSKDNAGFMEWASSNYNLLDTVSYLDTFYPNCHVYGEWLVPHTLKTYEKEAWRKFYIFDVVKQDGTHVHYEDYKVLLDKMVYTDYIVPMRVIKNPTTENLYKCLEDNDYLIKDGEGKGEGVVIKNYDFVNKYGRQTWAKIVTADFKQKHRKADGPPKCKGSDYVEEKIINQFLTDDIIDKVYSNIVTESEGWSSKMIPRLLHTVFYDLVREHSWDFIKKFKNPKIDYKVLNNFTTLRVKDHLSQLF
jgi:hypothetical protein